MIIRHRRHIRKLSRWPLSAHNRNAWRVAIACAVLALFVPHPCAAGVFRQQDFSPNSVWNTPLASNHDSIPIAALRDTAIGLDTWLQDDAWTIPCYAATPADAVHHLRYSADAWRLVALGRWRRFANPPSVEAEIRATTHETFPPPGNVFSSTSTRSWLLPSAISAIGNPPAPRLHTSPSMHPAAGADGHMAIAQPDGSVIETYAAIMLSSGDVVALSYARSSPNGAGDGAQNGQTASMIPIYAGVIQDQEIAAGIHHAMAITVPARLLAPRIAYPAAAFDRDALNPANPYRGTLPMGGRLALPATLDLAALHLATAPGRAIARAAQTYGFIAVDRGGDGLTIRIRPNGPINLPALHAWNQPLQADLQMIVSHLAMVSSGG